MTFFSKKLSLSNPFKHKETSSEATEFGRNARADWQVICISFLVLVLVAVAASAVMYDRINKEEIFRVVHKEPVSLRSLDRLELERTTLYYEKKRERFEALKRRPLSTLDPFIPSISARGN